MSELVKEARAAGDRFEHYAATSHPNEQTIFSMVAELLPRLADALEASQSHNSALAGALKALCDYWGDWWNTPDDQLKNDPERELKERIRTALSDSPAPERERLVAAVVEAACEYIEHGDEVRYHNLRRDVDAYAASNQGPTPAASREKQND